MTKLTTTQAAGMHRALEAEHESKIAATTAASQFPSLPVFFHLQDSADRHISTLLSTLHDAGLPSPALWAVPEKHYASRAEALDEAFDRETKTAAIYDQLLEATTEPALRHTLFRLWQSASHLHRSAIAHHLSIEDTADQG